MLRKIARRNSISTWGLALGLFGYGALGSCSNDATDSTNQALTAPAVEWVAFHSEIPFKLEDFHPLAAGLFGESAQAGQFIAERELSTGFFVQAAADPSTNTQARLTFAIDDGTNHRRLIAVAPASYSLGQVFISTVDVALAKMKADQAKSPGSDGTFFLEYRVRSSLGGKLSFGVRGDRGVYSLVVDVSTPRTQLAQANIGQPADSGGPSGSVAGTVYFQMNKDDFDFFVDRSYGKGATSRQNFTDFQLVPYEWLRLTVEPHLDQKFVNVGFEVVTLDGKRIPVAKAPASVLAGDLFRRLVSSRMGTMLAQEKAQPGSSTPWSSPFYYDNPDGGGVVQVIASGNRGIFSVAYAVESPQQPLTDVPFVEYMPVNIPPADPSQTASCEKLGDPNITPAPKGVFQISFAASQVIINSPDRMGPLKGDILCSIFNAQDVTVTGPTANAVSLQDFTVTGADLLAPSPPKFTSQELWAGKYQILCFQDLFAKGKVQKGDPVTLPIGSYDIGCNVNPVPVEFAILDPED